MFNSSVHLLKKSVTKLLFKIVLPVIITNSTLLSCQTESVSETFYRSIEVCHTFFIKGIM